MKYMSELYQEIPEEYAVAMGDKSKAFRVDSRTGFRVYALAEVDPFKSFDWYINYLTALSRNVDQWINFSYFDMGLVPLAMGPFMYQQILLPFFSSLTKELGCPSYILPAFTPFAQSSKYDARDLWVKREDICRVIGFNGDPNLFSTLQYIKSKEVSGLWVKCWKKD